MQEQMQKAQEEIANEVVEGTAGGGAVTVKATGTGTITEIKIKKEAIDPEDPETLEDLVLAAVNAALKVTDTTLGTAVSGKTGWNSTATRIQPGTSRRK